MYWKLALLLLLVAILLKITEGRKNRPPGAIPSPYKDGSNNSERRPHHQQPHQMKEVLASSHEALVVTERKYLKSDWCKTQPLRQIVSEEGCLSRTIINRFCYGQCNSFYIPRHVKREEESFQSCAFCKPQKFTSLNVELECPELDPPFRLKKIQKVKQSPQTVFKCFARTVFILILIHRNAARYCNGIRNMRDRTVEPPLWCLNIMRGP